MSKLYFRYGAMNSGKSTALIQVAYNYEERGQNVVIVKPSADTKNASALSRIGFKRDVDINATPDLNVRKAILEWRAENPVSCVLIDEAQFLTAEQVDQLLRLAVLDSIPVIAYGLRADFRTHAFPGSARLLEVAHSLEEMKTICRCGRKAVFNGRKINGVFVSEGSQVAIDGQQAEYESLCCGCYMVKVGLPNHLTLDE